MSAEQLGTRIVSAQTGLSSSDIRRGKFSAEQFRRIKDVERERSMIPFFIDDTGGLNLAQICSRARRLKRQHGLDLIVIDYLQLLAGSKAKARDGRVQELTEITSGLKALAKELNVPIIGLSQLNRGVENREDKRPQLSDLRESGSIEQDADVVMFVYRDAYYLELKEPAKGSDEHIKWTQDMSALAEKADIIVAKSRHGPTGAIEVAFERDLTLFKNKPLLDALPDGHLAAPDAPPDWDGPF
jgi:replicative DNA helicase